MCDMPAIAVLMQLEDLGYSIASISVVDSAINAAWLVMWLFRNLPAHLPRAAGVVTWLMLGLVPPPEFFMVASETSVAMHQAVLERGGVSPAAIRAKLLGKVCGSLLGGYLLHGAG